MIPLLKMKIVSNSALLSNENKERTFDLFKAGPSIWSEAVFSKNSLQIEMDLKFDLIKSFDEM